MGAGGVWLPAGARERAPLSVLLGVRSGDLDVVGDAFTHGFNVGMGVAAAAAFLAALAVLRWHPSTAAAPFSAPQRESADDLA